MFHDENLVWIDLEMTGLDPDRDAIIEIATLVTDKYLNILAEGPVFAIKQPEALLTQMDAWNTSQHEKSGLLHRVRQSGVSLDEAEYQTLNFLSAYVSPNTSPMCGNSICQDRRFLVRGMPTLANFFHYRNLDVSSIKEVARRWYPQVVKDFQKEPQHLALQDIKDSVAELLYYREHFFINKD